MATYKLLDPKGNVINTFNETDKADMEKMGLASGYSFVPATSTVKSTTPTSTTKTTSSPSTAKTYDLVDPKGNVINTFNETDKADMEKMGLASGYSFVSSGGSKTGTSPISVKSIDTNVGEPKAMPEAPKSSLVSFADALNQATTLARARRQESEMGILDEYGFTPGKVRAGTMGSILSLLEQSGGNREQVLQEAAIDAYKTEEANKAQEKTNIQELALQLLTKGVDQKVIQGIINSTSLDQAMLMAAGALKDEYEDIRVIDNKIVGRKDDEYVELYDGGSGGGGGTTYAPTTDMKEYEYAKLQGFTGTFEEWKNRNSGTQKTPTYAGERLDFGSQEVGWWDETFGNGISEYQENIDKLTALGISQSDIDEVIRLLQQGYSLKQIAQDASMPNDVYMALKEFITTD